MRRIVLLAGVAGVGAIATAWVRGRARSATTAHVPGAAPGRIGSWINAYLDRPLHAASANVLDLQPGDDLLDVACGAGYFLTRHAPDVARVAGVDLSEPKVRLARQRLADRIAAGTAEIVEGDAAALPWEDGRFSAVTCIDAFPMFPDPQRALTEMYRVLRPGGRAVIETGGTPEGTETHQARGPAGLYWAWSEPDIRRMAEAAGFYDVEISQHALAGDHRLVNQMLRRVFGTDKDTILAAVKPMPMEPAEDARVREAVALG